jgi:chemotaxis protein CheX
LYIEVISLGRDEVGSPSLRDSLFSGKEILTVVGITGQIRGQMYLGISKRSTLKMISIMMGGASVSAFDAIAQSAISELSNMIAGNAMTRFANEGISLDITPPHPDQ